MDSQAETTNVEQFGLDMVSVSANIPWKVRQWRWRYWKLPCVFSMGITSLTRLFGTLLCCSAPPNVISLRPVPAVWCLICYEAVCVAFPLVITTIIGLALP